jgi:uncharacterized membrane protein (DUF4010 family)
MPGMEAGQPTDITLLLHLGVALAIGLLVGLERGWRSRDLEDHGRAAGFRTFGLAGLLGGISGYLAQSLGGIVMAGAFVTFGLVFAAFHWIEAQKYHTASVTAVVAGLLTFGLGALAVAGPVQVAIAGAVAMTVLLSLRETLHGWVARLTWEEIRAVLILLVMTFLLLPVLPDRPIDPWNALNPREIWLLAILIATISFAGYVAVRLMGARIGILVTAAAGGLASSTATTLTLARLAAARGIEPQTIGVLGSGILVSSGVMVLRVAVVSGLLNPPVMQGLILPLLAALAVFAVASTLLLRLRPAETGEDPAVRIVIDNPLAIGISLRLAGFIALVMLGATLLQDLFGDAGLYAIAAISGIADVDAITISLSRLDGDADLAARGILLAVAVNTISKASMAWAVGGTALGIRIMGPSLLAVLAGGLILLV